MVCLLLRCNLQNSPEQNNHFWEVVAAAGTVGTVGEARPEASWGRGRAGDGRGRGFGEHGPPHPGQLQEGGGFPSLFAAIQCQEWSPATQMVEKYMHFVRLLSTPFCS